MKLAARCQWCGTKRAWERGADGIVRPEQTLGPHGVGHYPYLCPDGPAGRCEPRSESAGERMVRELGQAANRRYRRA